MTVRERTLSSADRRRLLTQRPDRLRTWGIIFFAFSYSCYMLIKYALRNPAPYPPDLRVYLTAGKIVLHVSPYYHPTLPSPIYSRIGPPNFTYPPFAAILFAIFALFPLHFIVILWVQIGIAALVVTMWAVAGRLDLVGDARIGAALVFSGITLWTEPVLMTVSMGQIELVLMALVAWDMCQPADNRWKGVGVGIAAGIKLTPLIFVPYLFLTRQYRAGMLALGAFMATVLAAFMILPKDSIKFWLSGVFLQSNRVGNASFAGNQSITGLVSRLAGSIAGGHPGALALSAIVGILGIAIGVVFQRAGHEVVGVLACAVTGVLISPISWDPHWVWVAPCLATLAVYGARGNRKVRLVCFGSAVVAFVAYMIYPLTVIRHMARLLWNVSLNPQDYMGLIYVSPNSAPQNSYFLHGDSSSFAEYHWYGLESIFGNIYVLGGLVGFAALLAIALVMVRNSAPFSTTRANRSSGLRIT